MKVRCKFCSHYEEGRCKAKKSGGKYPKVKANGRRKCAKYKIDPYALAEKADKEFEKSKIPTYAPTWRYYADKKELKELGEENEPLFIRINPYA
jgi:hypothetical protein